MGHSTGDGINCSVCNSTDTTVTETSRLPQGVHRRRKCMKCGFLFQTIEQAYQNDPPPKTREALAHAIAQYVLSSLDTIDYAMHEARKHL